MGEWCPESGNNHNQLPEKYRFCPDCRASLRTNKEQVKEIIVLDETPEKISIGLEKKEKASLVLSVRYYTTTIILELIYNSRPSSH